MPPKPSPAYERVMARTVEGPTVRQDLGPCLDAIMSRNLHGYPQVGAREGAGPYRPIQAARIVLAHELGRLIRPGHGALHHCDRRECVRASHLYEGTQRDNMRDMTARGRQRPEAVRQFIEGARLRRGEQCPHARLNDVAVRVIRYLASRGVRNVRLAQAYNISKGHVGCLVKRTTWTHLADFDCDARTSA
jgi:hypothetical protein